MNYFVLHCQTLKIERVCERLNEMRYINAFIPQMEKYLHSQDKVILQMMFPGYLLIKTEMDQLQFDALLYSMKERKDGIIKQLKKKDTSALSDDEIKLLNQLLNEQGILVMSKGYQENGKSIVLEGPLKNLQDHIVAVNKKDMLAVLNIQFLNRKIKAGIWIEQNTEM